MVYRSFFFLVLNISSFPTIIVVGGDTMIKTKRNKRLYEILKSGEPSTLNVKGVMENDNPDVYTNNLQTGVLVKDGYFHFVYSEDESFLNDVKEELKNVGYYGISGANKVVKDYLYKTEFIHWENPCKFLTLEHPHFTKDDLIESIDSLTMDDAEFVNDHYQYKHEGSLKKIQEAIEHRPTSCVRIEGVPVSYALLHEDNSIGYMYTLDEHRKKGYAFEVTKDIVLKTIASGRTPYVHIAHWNHKSIGLALKAGFKEVCDVYWFGVLNLKGDEIQAEIKRFNELYYKKATHLTNTLKLKRDFTPFEVTVEDKVTHIEATYQDTTYKIKYILGDEVYFMDIEEPIPNDVLRSILLNFLPEEEFVCFFHFDDSFDQTGFYRLNINQK